MIKKAPKRPVKATVKIPKPKSPVKFPKIKGMTNPFKIFR